MKEGINKVIIIGLFSLVLLAGCGSVDKTDFFEQTSSTKLTEEINAITIGSSESDVIKLFGEPDYTEETKDGTYLKYGNQEYKNVEFQIVNGIVERYFFSDKQYKSQKVAIGSSKHAVITEYGEDYYARDDSSAEVVGYFDKEKGINIEFALDESRVIGIEVSKGNN